MLHDVWPESISNWLLSHVSHTQLLHHLKSLPSQEDVFHIYASFHSMNTNIQIPNLPYRNPTKVKLFIGTCKIVNRKGADGGRGLLVPTNAKRHSSSITLIMEAVSTTQTSGNFCLTTRCIIPEETHRAAANVVFLSPCR